MLPPQAHTKRMVRGGTKNSGRVRATHQLGSGGKTSIFASASSHTCATGTTMSKGLGEMDNIVTIEVVHPKIMAALGSIIGSLSWNVAMCCNFVALCRHMKPCVFLVIPTLVVLPKVLVYAMALKAGKCVSTSFAESPSLISDLVMGKKPFAHPKVAGF